MPVTDGFNTAGSKKGLVIYGFLGQNGAEVWKICNIKSFPVLDFMLCGWICDPAYQ